MSAPRVPAGPNSLAALATRRCVLGAIAAAPLLAIPVTATAASLSDWQAAIADWEQVRQTWEGIAAQYAAAETAHRLDPTPSNKDAEDRLDALDHEWMQKDDEALERIVATPAPDIEAVIYKLRLGEEHGLNTTKALVTDLRRLSREGC